MEKKLLMQMKKLNDSDCALVRYMKENILSLARAETNQREAVVFLANQCMYLTVTCHISRAFHQTLYKYRSSHGVE